MSELRFDNRAAIVTGAGGNPGLGRSYAMLIASRGGKVVVNDLGVGPDGHGVQRAHADAVAKEIVDLGGEAVADTNSVAEPESARAVVQTALDAYGSVDILVNNAGVCLLADFDEISEDDIEKTYRVHLFGQTWMSRAVWPHMKAQGYGRIVSITSGAMFGVPHVSIYGAAKGGVYGLMRGLALEGAPLGIKANCVGPAAGTTAITHLNESSEWLDTMMSAMSPDLVAPAVAYLAHETCSLSGKYLEVAGGRVAEKFAGETRGYVNSELTVEDVRDNLDQVLDRDEFAPVADLGVMPEGFVIVPKAYQP
jgi:NAD(P)-dependent dehydrogenase (short-subunit alcohol dehydrogenase family)